MTLPEVTEQENGTEPKAPTSRTLLDEVRAQLQERSREVTLDIRLPIRQPRLVARYRVIDPDVIEQSDDGEAMNVAMLVHACEGLFVRTPDGLESLGITYATAAEPLGLEVESARELLLDLFEGNRIALATHADRVTTWMTDTSQEVEGQVLGESSASTSAT